jgi:hypothetical protein
LVGCSNFSVLPPCPDDPGIAALSTRGWPACRWMRCTTRRWAAACLQREGTLW